MTKLAATLLCSVFVLTLRVGAVPQRADAGSLPEGKGKDLVAAACVGCHDLSTAVSKRETMNEWRDTVNTMVERGAQISSADAAVIVTYLSEHYGASAAAAAEPTATLPDGPGRDVLMNKCFQCHSQGMWSDLRQDRRAWEGVLYRMVGRRALWTEDEINTMADYLARVRGPEPGKR
jgi:cytochrome c5